LIQISVTESIESYGKIIRTCLNLNLLDTITGKHKYV